MNDDMPTVHVTGERLRNLRPGAPRVISQQVERVSVAGGLTTTSALRALAAWMDETGRSTTGPITIISTTLATYASATFPIKPTPEGDAA